MNYLLEGIVGRIPAIDELNLESQQRIAMQNIITPESVKRATAKHTTVQVAEKVTPSPEESAKMAIPKAEESS